MKNLSKKWWLWVSLFSLILSATSCGSGESSSGGCELDTPFDQLGESSSGGNQYDTKSLAQRFQGCKNEDFYEILGANVIRDKYDSGIQFAVFAKNATRVEVLIFNNPESELPTFQHAMVKDKESGIWTLFVEGLSYGTHYGYIAFGPNWPYDPNFKPGTNIGYKTDCDEDGNRYNPNKLLIDPYTRRIHRDFDWSSGNPASGTSLKVSTYKAAAKSVVIKSEYAWSAHEEEWRKNRMKGDDFKGHAKNDLIFYEVHPMGFTKNAMDMAENHLGTWRGIGEKAQYLADLGITAVELMPVAEKPDDGTYWGYNTIAFFAPEQRFATAINQKKPAGVHDEFKEMVDKLHQAGIEVILDVVYNHTGEGGFWRSKVAQNDFDYGGHANLDDATAATIYSFRGLDNKEYYHLIPDPISRVKNQSYLDETGVGNQVRTNNKPGEQLILDNLRFWVEEMHVDGFRFDLASILGVTEEQVTNECSYWTDEWGNLQHDCDKHAGDNVFWKNNVQNTILQKIIDDPVMAKYHTRFIAEPWSLSQYANGLFPTASGEGDAKPAWFEWNGRFRDMMRPFVNEDHYTLNREENLAPDWNNKINIGNLLLGSSNMFGDDGRKPFHSINFLTAHDGFTLYDLESYNSKHNDCGKLNPICCTDRYNAFCDLNSGDNDNRSRNWCISNPDDGQLSTTGTCKLASDEAVKRQMIRNLFTLLFISHGSPMMLGGDEYMRTQYGNNNAYSDSANNEFNWFRWSDWVSSNERVRMHDYVRDIIKIRKQFKEFLSPAEYRPPTSWWWPNGRDDSSGWNQKSVALNYEATETTPALFIMINMEAYDKLDYTLPEGEWKILADTQKYWDYDYLIDNPDIDPKRCQNTWLDGSRTVSSTYSIEPRSIVILSK